MSFRRLKTAAVLGVLLLGHAAVMAHVPRAWAYLGWWLPDSWRSAPLARIDRLLFFELKVDASGAIAERNGWPEQWSDLRLALQQRGTPLDLTLTLSDPTVFEALFAEGPAGQRLLNEAVALVSQDGVAGLQLDFEIYQHVSPGARARYGIFVRELARQLRQQSPPRNLSVFFPMGGESLLYDAPTLAQVDQVVLQGYDAHWRASQTAGPVAPLAGDDRVTWEKAVAQGTSLGVAKDRLLLGFPLYGYEWRVQGRKTRGRAVGEGVVTVFAPAPGMPVNVRDRVMQYGAMHDPVSGSSYYQFTHPNGQFFEGWFEDWWSLRRKSEYLEKERLGGIAFFMLGYDNSELIDYFFKIQQPR